MKTIYQKPEMMVVILQHQGLLMQQSVNRVISGGDTGMKLGGGGSDNTGGVRTKESSGIWDEEW